MSFAFYYSFCESYKCIVHSQVKLGEPGWKERYYEEKFSAKTPEDIEAVRRDVVSNLLTKLVEHIILKVQSCLPL